MNQSIFLFFYDLAHRSDFVDNLVVFFAVYFPYVVVVLAGVFLLFHHEVFRAENTWQVFVAKRKEIFRAFIAGVLAWVISKALKLIIQIPRPFEAMSDVKSLFSESGFAFPSGHAAFFSALAFSIYFFHKKAGYVFLFFAFLIGLARVTGGVHYPVDILGGFALGFAIAYLVKKIA